MPESHMHERESQQFFTNCVVVPGVAVGEGALAAPSPFVATTPSELAAEVVTKSMHRWSLVPNDIDLLISCTNTTDFNNPGLVSCLLHRIGRVGIPGLELKHLATGPIHAFAIAAGMVEAGRAERVLIVGTELLSRYFGDRVGAPCAEEPARSAQKIFRDGAGTCLVTSAKQSFTKDIPRYQVSSPRFWRGSGRTEHFGSFLPQANRFPLRLTAADLAAGRHYPHLDSQAFAADLEQMWGAADIALDRVDQRLVMAPVFGALPQGTTPTLELLAEYGYCGAAGLLRGLCGYTDAASTLGLVGVSPGPSIASVVLRRASA